MTTKTISVHRALTELKNLEERIEEAIGQVVLVKSNRKSNDKINGITTQDFEKRMQASYDKAKSLIDYRNKLKSAVVQSNALTYIEVAGEKMTVAQAIERKTSIAHEKELLSCISRQYQKELSATVKENDAVPAKLEAFLTHILGNKEKHNPDEVKLHTETFMKRNEHELIDPLNAYDLINELADSINNFETEVDAILSEVNAITQVTLEV